MSATVTDHRRSPGEDGDEPFLLDLPERAPRRIGVSVAVVGLVLTLMGIAWRAEWEVADYASRVTSLERADTETSKRIGAVEDDRRAKIQQVDNDRRERDERRIKLANDLGVVNQRLSLLEMQTKWLNDWVKDNGLIGKRR